MILIVSSLLLMLFGKMDTTNTVHSLAFGAPPPSASAKKSSTPSQSPSTPREAPPPTGDDADTPDDTNAEDESKTEGSSKVVVLNQALCSGGGLVSLGGFSAGGHNHVGSGFCVHGGRSLSYGSHNFVAEGASISTRYLSDFSMGSDNPGLIEALHEAQFVPGLSAKVNSIVEVMRTGSVPFSDFPSYITRGPVFLNEIKPNMIYTPGTFYVVNGPVSFRSGVLIGQVAIYAKGGVSVGAKSVLDDVILVTPSKISLAAKSELGAVEELVGGKKNGGDTVLGIGTPCLENLYSVILVAGDGVSFGAQSQVRGAQIISRGPVSLAAQGVTGEGLYVETLGNISQGSQHMLTGCAGGLQSDFKPTRWQ